MSRRRTIRKSYIGIHPECRTGQEIPRLIPRNRAVAGESKGDKQRYAMDPLGQKRLTALTFKGEQFKHLF